MTADTLRYDGSVADGSYEAAMQRVEADPALLERTRDAHQQFVAQREAAPQAEGAAGLSAALEEHGARLDRAWERTRTDRAARERSNDDGEERTR